MTTTHLVAWCLWAVVQAAPLSAATEPVPADQPRVITMQNGAHLLLAPDSLAAAVDLGVWVEAGIRDEHPGTIGVSHLLEHLTTRGAAPGGGDEYRRRVELEGGTAAAFTTADFTCFTQTVPRAALEQAFRMEAARFTVKPTQAMVDQARAEVLAENRDRARANPIERGLQRIYATALPNHPYRWPVLGSEGDLRRLTPSDCAAQLRARYTPDHVWITVVGDFDSDEAVRLARRYFEPIKGRGTRDGKPPTQAEATGERRATESGTLPLRELVVGWRVPRGDAADPAALDLLATLLSRGAAGRLQRRMVGGGQALLFAQAGRDARRDGSMFWAAVAVRSDVDSAAVERALVAEVEKLASETVEGEELDRARRHLELSLLFDRETARGRGQALGTSQMISGDWRQADGALERIRTLTPAALQQAAARTLTATRRTVVWFSAATPGGAPDPPPSEPRGKRRSPGGSSRETPRETPSDSPAHTEGRP